MLQPANVHSVLRTRLSRSNGRWYLCLCSCSFRRHCPSQQQCFRKPARSLDPGSQIRSLHHRTRALSVLAPWLVVPVGPWPTQSSAKIRPSAAVSFFKTASVQSRSICIKVCSMLPLPLVFAFVFLSDICPTAAQTKTIDNTLKAIIRFIVHVSSPSHVWGRDCNIGSRMRQTPVSGKPDTGSVSNPCNKSRRRGRMFKSSPGLRAYWRKVLKSSARGDSGGLSQKSSKIVR